MTIQKMNSMHEVVFRWTLLWWTLDGVGLLLWATVAGGRRLWGFGMAQLAFGLLGLYMMNSSNGMQDILIIPTLVGIICLTTLRNRGWSRRESAKWNKKYKQFGEPTIWTGGCIFILLFFMLIALIASTFFVAYLTKLEKNLLELGAASTVVMITGPGGIGLSTSLIARWLMRLITIGSYGVGFGLILRSVLKL